MIKSFVLSSLFIGLLITAAATSAFSQCMRVDVPESIRGGLPITAQVFAADCAPGFNFLNIQLTAQSSSPVITPQAIAALFSSQGQVSVQFSTTAVNACTPVTLTFSAQINGQTQTVTRTVTVCQFAFDIQTRDVRLPNIVSPPANQEVRVAVTVRNQGAQTLFANSYSVSFTLAEEENMRNHVRRNCASPISDLQPVNINPQVDIRPGEERVVEGDFRFPQGGSFNLKATASISGAEDGPDRNANTSAALVNVTLPPPLVCAVSPTTAVRIGDTITVRGNWFRRFGTNETPTVSIGNRPAEVVNVISPLEMTVRVREVDCAASGQVNITVDNTFGITSSAAGPTLAPLEIAGFSTDNSPPGLAQNLTINLTNFRQSCPATVTLEPLIYSGGRLVYGNSSTLQTLAGGTANSMVVRVFATSMYARIYMVYRLSVVTPYGTATKSFSRGPKYTLPVLQVRPNVVIN